VVLLILAGVGMIVGRLELPEDRRKILETIHFWAYYALLLVLGLNLIIKIILSVGRSK
jgi:TRAP-type uncharacterized transport system fused permease subunit